MTTPTVTGIFGGNVDEKYVFVDGMTSNHTKLENCTISIIPTSSMYYYKFKKKLNNLQLPHESPQQGLCYLLV